MRAARATRLSAMQRLAQVTEEVRQWVMEHLDMAPTNTVPQKIEPAEAAKQGEKTAPTVKAPETPGERLRPRIAQPRQQQQRRSRGISM